MVALSFDDLTGKNRQIPQQEEEKPTPIPKSIGYPVSKDAVNDELLSLFPSPVLIAQYPVPYEKELEYIQNLPCRRENKGGDVGQKIHYNRQSEDTFVLDNPELSNVREFIKSKIFKFVREVMCSKDEVVITQSWINKSGKGESHHEHVHPNSMISGVWYPVINEQLPPIQFRSRTQRDISFSNEKFNNFNSATFLLPMKMGEIIIFPSNLSHCVPANQSETERISLAFNTWVKGSLGDINSLTYLPLDRCV